LIAGTKQLGRNDKEPSLRSNCFLRQKRVENEEKDPEIKEKLLKSIIKVQFFIIKVQKSIIKVQESIIKMQFFIIKIQTAF